MRALRTQPMRCEYEEKGTEKKERDLMNEKKIGEEKSPNKNRL